MAFIYIARALMLFDGLCISCKVQTARRCGRVGHIEILHLCLLPTWLTHLYVTCAVANDLFALVVQQNNELDKQQ